MFFFSLHFMRITLKVSFGLLVAVLLTGCRARRYRGFKIWPTREIPVLHDADHRLSKAAY